MNSVMTKWSAFNLIPLSHSLIWLGVSVALSGCAIFSPHPDLSASTDAHSDHLQILKLSKLLKQKDAQIAALHERLLVLEPSKSASHDSVDGSLIDDDSFSVGQTPDGAIGAPSVSALSEGGDNDRVIKSAAVKIESAHQTDRELYGKILDLYQARNANELQNTLDVLLKRYSQSVFVPHAIYLSGLLAFESKNDEKARREFVRVANQYPQSGKAVAAMFAIAEIDKRSNRTALAIRELNHVNQSYPGSREAMRSQLELKLLASRNAVASDLNSSRSE
jgi:TolA-binding protein